MKHIGYDKGPCRCMYCVPKMSKQGKRASKRGGKQRQSKQIQKEQCIYERDKNR